MPCYSPRTPLNNKQRPGDRGDHSDADSEKAQVAEEWCKRGDEGGGIVKGRRYSAKECYGIVVSQSHVKDRTRAKAWNRLGELGGHQGSGRIFSRLNCFREAIEWGPQALYWLNLAACMGGGTTKTTKVAGVERDVKYCCWQAFLETEVLFDGDIPLSDPALGYAWHLLGLQGGGEDYLAGREYSSAECFRKALCYADDDHREGGRVRAYGRWPHKDRSWLELGILGGGKVGRRGSERHYDKRACYIESLKHSPTAETNFTKFSVCFQARAWINLGDEGGGRIWNQDYSRQECYLRALNLRAANPTEQQDSYGGMYAAVWMAVGKNGGNVRVGKTVYTEEQCYSEAMKLDPKNRRTYELLLKCNNKNYMAWNMLASLGGGTVAGTVYDQGACSRMAHRHSMSSLP